MNLTHLTICGLNRRDAPGAAAALLTVSLSARSVGVLGTLPITPALAILQGGRRTQSSCRALTISPLSAFGAVVGRDGRQVTVMFSEAVRRTEPLPVSAWGTRCGRVNGRGLAAGVATQSGDGV
jgi:hypothetical protein